MAVDVRSWFLKELDIDMPVLKVLGGGSVISLLDDAMDRLPASFFKFDVAEGKVSAPVQKDTALSSPTPSNEPSTETSSINNQSLSESPSGSATPPSSDSDKDTTPGSSNLRDIVVESSTEISEMMSFGQTRFWFLSDTVHYIIVGSHHITLDGFSFSNLFTDLEGAYSGRYLSPLPAKSQYRAFATQQRKDYEAGQMNTAIEYYRRTISNDLKPIPLFSFATTSTRQTLDAYSLHEAKVTLNPALASRIKALGRKCRATAFHVYLAAFQAFLFRLLPEMDDLFIGIADANRTDKKFLGSLGFFLNLLPLKFEKGSLGGTKVSGALNDARNKAYTALEHSKLPFDVLLNELNISRSGSHTPIFQVFVDYRQVVQERKSFGDCETGDERWLNAKTGYDLSLEITDNPGDESLLVLRLQEALYSKESTELLLNQYLKDPKSFNMAVKVRLSGPLRLHAMERAVEVVCQRHEALRTRFFTSGDDEDIPSQGILSKSLVGLEVKTIHSESEADDELEYMHDHVWDLQYIKIRLLTLRSYVSFLEEFSRSSETLIQELPLWPQKAIDDALEVGKGK